MANPIRFLLLPFTILSLFNCGDILFEDEFDYDLTTEQKAWLNDKDDDGVADSLDKYAEDCNGPIMDCLKTAQENKKQKEKRTQDSLQLVSVDFSHKEGLFYEVFQVELTTKGEGIIRYNTNGAEPTEKSPAYNGPIPITVSTHLKARTFSKTNHAGPVKSASYELKVKKPTAMPEGGGYTDTIKVMLACNTDKATIFFTSDGSKPSFSSAKFEDSLEIKNTTRIITRALREGWTPSDTLEVRYRINIPGTVVGPVFTPEAGTYHESQKVSISSETEGAEIFYTLNGNKPDSSSRRYSDKIAIDSGMTIKAMAIKEGMKPSASAPAQYVLKASKPEFDPSPKKYFEEQSVAITVKSPGGAEIYYTTDGQVPTDSSERYKDAILVNKSLTIKARAFYKNWEPSEMGEALYNINIPGEVPAPVFNPVGGTFPNPTSVNISSAEGGAKIYYTTNDEKPSVSDSLFESDFTIYDNTTIRAIAVDTGGKTSEVTEAVFTILQPIPDTLGPSISLVDPSWKDTMIFAADVVIEVKADDPSGVESVTINGETASLSAGKYTQTLTLSSGENKIVVMAEDESAYKNKSADTLKITYDPPPDAVTLFPPTQITGKGMRIKWSQNHNTDFTAYKIFFSTRDSVNTSDSLEYEEKARHDTVFNFSGLTPHRTYYVKVFVFDNNSSAGSNEVSAFLNTAPVFKAVAGQSLNENTLLSFTIYATDADGDNLTYSMFNPPVGDGRPVFGSIAQTFSWTPTYTDSGKYVAKFEVTDNALVPLRDTLLVDITVKNFNGDSLVVRNLLDENGFASVAVDKNICNYAKERITELHLDSSRIRGKLASLPAEIGNLTGLRVFSLLNNKLTRLPEEIGNLVNLTIFDISGNQVSSLPSTVGNLTSLQSLYMNGNKLAGLPAGIWNLTDLRTLKLDANELTSLPSEIGSLTELRLLSLEGNKLTSLPPEMANLSKLGRLEICDMEFTGFPEVIFKLTSLTDLIMRNNQFKYMPKEIGQLVNLKYLYTPAQKFTELPAEIGNLSKMQNLLVSHCNLTSLPGTIGKLTALMKLNIYANQLSDLPSEIVNLQKLTDLDVKNNKLCKINKGVKEWINKYSSDPKWENFQSCFRP